jgi:hypothetical protein
MNQLDWSDEWDKEVQYRHFYNRKAERPKGAITFAYLVDKENRQMQLGISFCSKKDYFSKKTGRIGSKTCEGALPRLKREPLIVDMVYLGDKPLIKRTLNDLVGWLFSCEFSTKWFLVKLNNNPSWFASVPEEDIPNDWWDWN